MSSIIRIWIEIVFDITYLLTIWVLAACMFKKVAGVRPKDLPVAQNMMLAFVLLALGDTGHVGFRILAYYMGSLEAKLNIFGVQLSLTGAGTLTTAITVTFFYVIILDAWRKRFDRKYGVFEYILIIAAIIRLILFISPGNQWNSVVPPFGWSVARNIPLMVQGLGVAFLILRDAFRHKDKTFKLIGTMILVSYSCYMPVIFLVQKVSWIGMLMIPKTIAYVAIAVVVYKELFARARAS
ncbi:MAG: hypothetical protein WBL93_03195 [Lutisporaceae bacterium]